jgi:antitoxin HicB
MAAKRTLTYRIVLKEEPEGGYTVSVPTLPGCITYGENREDAFTMVKEAITAYLESQSRHGELIVDDSQTFEGVLSLEYA